MAKHVIPPQLTTEEKLQLGSYTCPLCKVQTTVDEIDVGWVYCPMVENKAICLGCCIDYQSVARSDNFNNHTFRDLFDDAELVTGKNVIELRSICLQHQEKLLKEKLDSDSKDREQFNSLLHAVQQALLK